PVLVSWTIWKFFSQDPSSTKLLLWPLLLMPPLWAQGQLPVRDPALCQPIHHHPDLEVFVFRVCDKTGKTYDRSQITTVAVFGKRDSGLRCYAHSRRASAGLNGDVWVKKISILLSEHPG
uniref:Uncharacterized protein n=1 Tax=Rhinolophus ferrumequinum TaxID=59479 RepID=A0A671EYR2_RHIFE